MTEPLGLPVCEFNILHQAVTHLGSKLSHNLGHVVVLGLDRDNHTLFWSTPRRYVLEDAEISRLFYNVTKAAFDEDQAMIEAQQRRIDSDPRKSPLADLDGDAASVAARRLIAKKLASDTIAAAEAAE